MGAETNLTGFEPNRRRGQAINARMRRRLRDSLEYIAGQAEAHLNVPRTGLAGFFDRIQQGPISPLVFGAYYDLVVALDEDDLARAENLLNEIAASPNMPDGPRIVELSDPLKDAASARYCRLTESDDDMEIALAPPGDGAARLRAMIAEALRLIDAGHPGLGGEIRAIVREIVLAHGAEGANGMKFDGVSCFMLWGGVILNVTGYSTVVEVVQALAHESGHNLLFGLCADGPLQENDDAERYPSPLRIDMRPMDGIVHATYVTARMHDAIGRLLNAGVLDAEQREEGLRANLANAKSFAAGIETIDRHARLTPLGRTVMAGARDYMRDFCT